MPGQERDEMEAILLRGLAAYRERLEVLWRASVDSTSSELRRQLAAGRSRPALLAAGYQTVGRGTRGRVWMQGRPGADIALTLAVHLPAWAAGEQRLGLLCAVWLARVLEAELGIQLGLKWPNDLLVQDSEGNWRKTGGLLLELLAVGPRQWLLLGVGLNACSQVADFPLVLQSQVMTLADALGAPPDLARLQLAVATCLCELLLASDVPPVAELSAAWNLRDRTPGTAYRLELDGRSIEVTAAAVDWQSGGLICTDSAGAQYTVYSYGDLSPP
jgi:BirA family biotin operon repressor/biotin-[acetyl-CoA-carboxylase] ligase